MFPMQFIIQDELDSKKHVWLRSLRNDLSIEDARAVLLEGEKLLDNRDKTNFEALLEISAVANQDVYRQLQEENGMNEAALDIIRPGWREELKKGERAFEKEIKYVLRYELHDEIKEELHDEIKEELRDELTQELRDEMAEELRQKVRLELRDEMAEEVRQKVRQELREEVTEEVRREFVIDSEDKHVSIFYRIFHRR